MSNLAKDHLGLELKPRSEKPRTNGITSVIDIACPYSIMRDVLEMHGAYVDVVKLTDNYLSAPLDCLQKRLALLSEHDVGIQPNGAFLEMAQVRGQEEDLLRRLRKLGFTHVEISTSAREGGSAQEDQARAKAAMELGFVVIGEVGKKSPTGDRTRNPDGSINIDQTILEIEEFLALGVEHVYWEGHVLRTVIGETPEAVEANRASAQHQIHTVADAVGADHLVFEVTSMLEATTRRLLQQWLVHEFGSEVNIGNCLPMDVAFFEHIRRGTMFVHDSGQMGDHPWIRSLSAQDNG